MTDMPNNGSQNIEIGDYVQQKEEGNYQDDASAPIVQCENNKNLTPYSDDINQPTEETSGNTSCENYQTPPNNNKNINRRRIRNVHRIHLPDKKVVFAYILFSLSIIDILLQIIFGCVNLYFMIDDLAVLAFSSLIIYSDYKKKDIRNYYMAALTVIIWFGGFGIKGYGLASSFKFNAVSAVFFGLIFIKGFTMFCYIPIICP